jgi:hypothetical protein
LRVLSSRILAVMSPRPPSAGTLQSRAWFPRIRSFFTHVADKT